MNNRKLSRVGWIALPILVAILVSCAVESPGSDATPGPALTASSPTTLPAPPGATAVPLDGASEAVSTATPSAGAVASDPTPFPTPTFREYRVEPGDTLLGIAMTYDVPMAIIQQHNQMGSSIDLFADEVLIIPPAIGWESASPFWVQYVVEAGDTLIEIADRHQLTVEELQGVNGLIDADELSIGQELILPLEAPALAYAPPPTATPVPPPTVTPVPAEATVAPTAPPEPTAPASAVTAAEAPPADVAAWPQEVARIINQVRAQHGLPPLTYNETLAVAAQGHANDCSQRGWCSHTGSDGADLNTRLLRVGYDPTGRAECWAMSHSPQHAIDMWMDEVPPNDAHRRTLLTTFQTEIGVGVAEAPWGYTYFIADFGRP
jgi:uncharacterized protein YkwD